MCAWNLVGKAYMFFEEGELERLTDSWIELFFVPHTYGSIVVIPTENITMHTIEVFTTLIATSPEEATFLGTITIVIIPIWTIPMDINQSVAIPNAISWCLLPQCEGPSEFLWLELFEFVII